MLFLGRNLCDDQKSIKFILEDKSTNGIFLYTLGRAKSNGSINFVPSLKLGEDSIFRRPPKILIFSMQLVFFTVERKSSQIKIFFRKVFMICLEHFSLKCRIYFFYFWVNDPLNNKTWLFCIFGWADSLIYVVNELIN